MKFTHAAEAPANIALIKYMGKVKGSERNKPTNPSFSFTLNHLLSRVEISETNDSFDLWNTIKDENWIPTKLSDRGRKRFLTHFGFLKQKLGINGVFEIRSANNFPSDCGIASSASSFAALTMASYKLAKYQNVNLDISIEKLAELSRIGSGSSIRSFISPFVLWDEKGISALELPYQNFYHQVVIVDHEKKAIGSSDAHERVSSSLLFHGRPERAKERLSALVNALSTKNWQESFEITWAEFWDMHALFATSKPSFYYMSAESLEVINKAHNIWQEKKDGPLVTMDAGANVHFIYREDQLVLANELFQYLSKKFKIISSPILASQLGPNCVS